MHFTLFYGITTVLSQIILLVINPTIILLECVVEDIKTINLVRSLNIQKIVCNSYLLTEPKTGHLKYKKLVEYFS